MGGPSLPSQRRPRGAGGAPAEQRLLPSGDAQGRRGAGAQALRQPHLPLLGLGSGWLRAAGGGTAPTVREGFGSKSITTAHRGNTSTFQSTF